MTGVLPTAMVNDVSAEFGYYPLPWSVETNRFSIETLPDHGAIVEGVEGSPTVSGGWIYPGLSRTVDFNNQVHLEPFPRRVFGLPKTHVLTIKGTTNRQELEFVVWCISFFVGMRLTTTEASFLDAASIKAGKLVDFFIDRRSLSRAVELSLDYWLREISDPKAPKRVTPVIHALFLAQRPQSLCFEQFSLLYTALDACWKLMDTKRTGAQAKGHGDRIPWMCAVLNIPVPEWADRTLSTHPDLAYTRNHTVHEALFFDEPLGFSGYGGNQPGGDPSGVILQMQALVCRLLVAILDKAGNAYVSSPIDTRQIHGLDF